MPHPPDNECHVSKKRNRIAKGEDVISASETKELAQKFVDLSGDRYWLEVFQAAAASQEGRDAPHFGHHVTAPYPGTIVRRIRTHPETQNRVSIPRKRYPRVIGER